MSDTTTTTTIDKATAVSIVDTVAAYVKAEGQHAQDALAWHIENRGAALDAISPTWDAARKSDAELSVPTFYDRVKSAAGRKSIPTLAQFRDVLNFRELRTAWFRGAYIAKVNRDHADAVAAAIKAVDGTDKAAVLPRPKRPTFSGYLSFARRAKAGHYDAKGQLTADGIADDKERADKRATAAQVRIATTTWRRDVSGTDEQQLAELIAISEDLSYEIAALSTKVGTAGVTRARKVVTTRRNTATAALSAAS